MRIGPKTLRNCATVACGKPTVARSLCTTCYKRAERNGSLPPRRILAPLHKTTVWLSDTQESSIQREARISGRSYSEIIRDAIERYFSAAAG